MAKVSLSVDLYREGRWIGELRKYGGNTTDVRYEFFKYTKMNVLDVINAFPNYTFQFGDVIAISCKYGVAQKVV